MVSTTVANTTDGYTRAAHLEIQQYYSKIPVFIAGDINSTPQKFPSLQLLTQKAHWLGVGASASWYGSTPNNEGTCLPQARTAELGRTTF